MRVILCRLPEKGRKEREEIVEEMKAGDREERGTGMKVKKQKKYKNSAEGVIAPAGAKVTGATIRTWLLNKFISFLAVLTWKTGLKKM